MQLKVVSIFFVLAVLILFYSLRKEVRPYILFIASIIYPFFLGRKAGIAIIAVSLLVYIGGLLIGYLNTINKKRINSILVVVIITAIVGIIIITKYFKNILLLLNIRNFIPDNSFLYSICIPVGLSFYGFQAISYVLDIYNGEICAEKNIVLFHIYMAWFPKFICGPIERTEKFVLQLHNINQTRLLNAKKIKKSVSYILIGCFYKMVVADRTAYFIGGVFSSPESYRRSILLISAILFSIQIYCDFAGYSMVAVGVSELFGISLTENFNAPYFSHNISEFWDRWHISLTSWLKKYIYIPLGGNRKGRCRKYINIIIVFLISGIWHGAGIGFIVWGLLHGLYSVIDNLILNNAYKKIRDGFTGRCITFVSVTFAWIFFYTGSVRNAIHYIGALLIAPGKAGIFDQLTLVESDNIVDFVVLSVAILIIVIFDNKIYKKTLNKLIEDMTLLRWCLIMWIILLLVTIFGVYGPNLTGNQLIYMQF